jgi:hypothetical protein
MSSATSIEGPAPPTAGSGEPAADVRAAGDRDGFKAWHFFVLVSLLGATAAVVVIRQPAPEHLLLLSVIVGAAGACGAALYRTLWPLVRADAVVDDRGPVSGRARAVLEREKMLALRSIKELEFDRAMGKVSPADFDELSGKLRARALSIMKQLDASPEPYRATIEQELALRLAAAAPVTGQCACGTSNDGDAYFCKRCGARLRA